MVKYFVGEGPCCKRVSSPTPCFTTTPCFNHHASFHHRIAHEAICEVSPPTLAFAHWVARDFFVRFFVYPFDSGSNAIYSTLQTIIPPNDVVFKNTALRINYNA